MRPNPPELDEELEEELLEETTSEEPLGSIPRFPKSPSPPTRPTLPNQDRVTVPEEPAGPSPEDRSSPASTEQARPKEPQWVDPKDLQAAIAQTVDIGFVLVGQGLGQMERRAKQLPGVDPKWVPTPEERKMVQEPASRIAKRHVKAGAEAADIIDGCLVAAGVGNFAVRGLFGVSPLGEPANEP